MRMHRKANLDERLTLCSPVLTNADLSDRNMKRAAEQKDYFNFETLFGNRNPVHLEIGCGKGKFVLECAALHPEINFLAVEKISNVIIEGCEKLMKDRLPNVHFLCCAAEVLPRYIAPHSIERIYLNFSNPLPKLGYAKQRLTHPRFLQLYNTFLKEGGEIWQKTDNADFFEFSLQSYREEGFTILSEIRDLKNNPIAENVVTEHEQKFMDMGLPIYRAVVRKKEEQ
jgi:tRNA (guanine-N7-)-methyltransferase